MGWGQQAAPAATALETAGLNLAAAVRQYKRLRTTILQAKMFAALDRFDEIANRPR